VVYKGAAEFASSIKKFYSLPKNFYLVNEKATDNIQTNSGLNWGFDKDNPPGNIEWDSVPRWGYSYDKIGNGYSNNISASEAAPQLVGALPVNDALMQKFLTAEKQPLTKGEVLAYKTLLNQITPILNKFKAEGLEDGSIGQGDSISFGTKKIVLDPESTPPGANGLQPTFNQNQIGNLSHRLNGLMYLMDDSGVSNAKSQTADHGSINRYHIKENSTTSGGIGRATTLAIGTLGIGNAIIGMNNSAQGYGTESIAAGKYGVAQDNSLDY
jgi:hypothetical protein